MLRYLLCMLLYLFPNLSFAEVRLAVLEFHGVGLERTFVEMLTDEVRFGVLEASEGHKIKGETLTIMTRENILEILKDQGLSSEDCVGECEVEITKNIGADYVISFLEEHFFGAFLCRPNQQSDDSIAKFLLYHLKLSPQPTELKAGNSK